MPGPVTQQADPLIAALARLVRAAIEADRRAVELRRDGAGPKMEAGERPKRRSAA